jgi:hypothetical protein
MNTPLVPYYTLKQLMLQKYGAEKFAIGCVIVATWVNGGKGSEFKKNLKGSWLCYTVEHLCNTTEEFPALTVFDVEKLRQLFGLKSIAELFTGECPEVIAANYQLLKERELI